MKPVAFFALLCFAIPAASQSTGANVAGVVTDSSGARLPDAKVSIALVQSGQSVTMTTGREGEYRAVALLPGAYELSAERLGFTRVARRITLLVGADATVNFILPIAGVNARATVVAEIPLPCSVAEASTHLRPQAVRDSSVR